ncbi:MAG: glycosyltransferase, partial [Chlamydiia bacterium]|nr:glycosyltransferase [Chlamydiia bacterium]
MKVLLISRYFPPLDAIATHRMYAWAKYLDRLGCEVTVLTTSKQGQCVSEWNWDRSRFEVLELDYWDPILACGFQKGDAIEEAAKPKGWKGRIKAGLKRFYRERMNERMPSRTDPWLFPARRKLRCLRKEGRCFDCVISSYGPPACHLLGRYAQKIFGARWIADYRDLWLENHVFAGLWPFTLLERALEFLHVRHADGISTVSDALATVLQSKFPLVPVTVIENGFEPELIQSAHSHYFDDAPPRFRIVYTGSIYRGKRDPSPLFRVLEDLRDEGIIRDDEVEVLFYGSQSADLPELIEKAKLGDMVRMCGYVGQQDAYAIQKSADLLLFLEAPRPDIDGILTGKLFEYLYVDTPILAIGVDHHTAAGQLILEARAGAVCGTSEPQIRQACLHFLKGDSAIEKRRSVVERFYR